MKRLLALLALIIAYSQPVWAADTLKIGVIDMSQVLQKSPLMLSINDKLAQKFTPRQTELNDAKKQFQDDSDQLTLKGDTMAAEQRATLQNKIIADKANVATLQANFERDLAIAKNDDLQTFMSKLGDVIKKVAKDGGYDLIEQRSNIIYLNEKLDITQKVIQMMTVN